MELGEALSAGTCTYVTSSYLRQHLGRSCRGLLRLRQGGTYTDPTSPLIQLPYPELPPRLAVSRKTRQDAPATARPISDGINDRSKPPSVRCATCLFRCCSSRPMEPHRASTWHR
jgi:hypothetical protein